MEPRVPMLTWIVPVYNGEKYIQKALESILNQPCRDFEIIVVDDGSDDETPRILERMQCNQLRILRQENLGVSAARNAGIRAARSTYLAFLDADDVLCRDVYTWEFCEQLRMQHWDLVGFSYWKGDQKLKFGNRVPAAAGEFRGDKTRFDHHRHISSFLYHRSLTEGEAGLRFPEGIRFGEDSAFLFCASRRAKRICFREEPFFVYRNNSQSVLHTNRACDYLPTDVIPAWQWAKAQCEDEADKLECTRILFALVMEYVRNGCMEGIPARELRKVLNTVTMEEALGCYDDLWDAPKGEYERFRENPEGFWKVYRRKGRLLQAVRWFARTPVFRPVYLRLQYREKISAYLW